LKTYQRRSLEKRLLWPGNLFEAMTGICSDYNVNIEYVNYLSNLRPIIYPVYHFAWSFTTLIPTSYEY